MPRADHAPLPRLLPERAFPPYAYLPGKFPHPVRDPSGHSHEPGPTTPLGTAPIDPDAFRWGIDLFNGGYYWEAHEAWEPLWRAADRNSADRQILKGLILMAAEGVKLREGKDVAARRHGSRAAALFRSAAAKPQSSMQEWLGVSPATLAAWAEASVPVHAAVLGSSDPTIVFSFILGQSTFGDKPQCIAIAISRA